ncbi:hypothetical protein CAOG_009915 [Capsaspora owczarzaki ATCC 30864]|uniref:Uncharacterized protein n=1 Tax=Capsaspora owczarzaki (strain ATCC 30864) TaxID=595528 RepID=A0A0D2WST0_CAPO3|nr:hypothetical protein CAOG_009915 [Capsaspora owczarzaki ATCC 30864]
MMMTAKLFRRIANHPSSCISSTRTRQTIHAMGCGCGGCTHREASNFRTSSFVVYKTKKKTRKKKPRTPAETCSEPFHSRRPQAANTSATFIISPETRALPGHVLSLRELNRQPSLFLFSSSTTRTNK